MRVPLRWVGRNVLPGVAITLVMLLLFAGIGEAYLRYTVPFRSSGFKQAVLPGAGPMRFEPGTDMRLTDGVSYWTSERVNSLGFVDREPPTARPPGTCRIVLVGDSFVIAGQVPNASKVQARLETHLSEARGGRPVQAIAFGTFGIGHVNALGYLDVVRPLSPDLLILVAADNDFSNNSAVLSGLRYGWHPDHQFRLAYRHEPTGELVQVGPDDSAASHLLFVPTPPMGPYPLRMRAHAWAAEHSYLYDRLFRLTSRAYPEVSGGLLPESVSDEDVKVRRMEQIRAIPRYQNVFDGWRFPDDLFEDYVFHADTLPPLFADAEGLTRHAFQRFREVGADSGFHVLIAAESSLSVLPTALRQRIRDIGEGDALNADGVLTRPVTVADRRLLPRGAFSRLQRIADDLALPVVDLYDGLRQMGPIAATRIPYDSHWSAVGHDRIARVLASYLTAHPALCDGAAGGSKGMAR